jgi:(p)ppGpp synthase/HD superfamily hydrolase
MAITYTARLDKAIRTAAWAHEQAGQHRKGTDIPYIIHPFGVMTIASRATDDEDTLIACLLHDVLEDVDVSIYDERKMREDFGDRVVAIVKDVTKDDTQPTWRAVSEAYLDHLEHRACDQAVTVSAADKVHNLHSVLFDYDVVGDDLWQRFSTKSADDQLWWYEAILAVIEKRGAPKVIRDELAELTTQLRSLIHAEAVN